MKKMTKVLALVLALAMCLALCACGKGESKDTAGDKKTFIMGVDPEYPPFSYLGDDGKFTGFDVEICQAVCDLLGWDLQVFGVNWDQKLVQLDSKECDCVWSGMTILDSMKDAGYVLSTPYYDNTQVIMVKEGSDIKSSADLAGKNVAVQLGTSGESLLTEGGDLESLAKTFGKLTTCDSFLKCFTELGGGAVDAVIVRCPRGPPTSRSPPTMRRKTAASPSSARNWARSSTALPSVPVIRSCATPSRTRCSSWSTTAPMPRSPRSTPTSSTT
mgnify:CR=1 FL=1